MPTFHGLFIGVDRYAHPAISWLSGAGRDAAALHALFADTFGDEALLLVDGDATHARIEREIRRIAADAGPEDLVVVAYAGHGSKTFELLPHDADPADLPSSALPLDTLASWLDEVDSRTLLCLLDCCFSGGMGTRGFPASVAPRDVIITTSALDQLSGHGRLVFTASAADEFAWESQTSGQGFFTEALIQALRGAPEVVDSGKLSLYKVFEFVSKTVAARAAVDGASQNPTIRGAIDAAPSWPIFVAGSRFLKLFSDQAPATATPEISSLTSFGFPAEILDAWSKEIPTLNNLQLAAINDFGVLRGQNLLVSAPTSSGKTLIGELVALHGAPRRRRSIFLLPMRALVNDKFQQFRRVYDPVGIRTVRATGEYSDDVPDVIAGRYDICLMTYEKFSNLALAFPHILRQVGTIVVDEIQMVTDPTRGVNLEFALTLLRATLSSESRPQLLCLSAVIGETNGFERWLNARCLRTKERPVPLVEGVLKFDGQYRCFDENGTESRSACVVPEFSGKNSSQDLIIPLVRRLAGEQKSTIVFRSFKGETVGCARYLAREINLPPATRVLDQLPDTDDSFSTAVLRETLQSGIAFHNSDLSAEERRLLEEEFRRPDSNLRVLVATTTLAMGVNTPAAAVIIAGLMHPGSKPFSVAEYKNMVGRAGRLGITERGEAYTIPVDFNEHDLWETYVNGTPEDMRSWIIDGSTADPRTLILRVLATVPRRASMTSEAVIVFLEGSFGVFLKRLDAPGWNWDRQVLVGALEDLVAHNLVEQGENDALRLTELGRYTGEAGAEVESIIRLVSALQLMSPPFNTATLITLAQLTIELNDVYIPVNTQSKIKEPQSWERELEHQGVGRPLLGVLSRWIEGQADRTRRLKRACACLYWASDIPLSDVEKHLTQHDREKSIAGPVRAVSTRTRDLIPVTMRVVEQIHPGAVNADLEERLLLRLEIGIPASIVELGSRAGTALTRGDYLALLRESLTSREAIEDCSPVRLKEVLGGNASKVELLKGLDWAETDSSAIPLLPPPTE